MRIEFSPPDITQLEIDEVVDTLKSGWITTGPKTKRLEQELSVFTNTDKTVCLNSATAAMELTLRVLGVGAGDEVITCAYTYSASASVIDHVGAKIILVDTNKEDKFMDLEALERKPCKYDEIFEIVERKKALFKPNNKLQEKIGRVVVMADAAHSLGAEYKGKPSGSIADFTCFSFHAVKNFTVAEGGSVTWNRALGLDDDEIYREFQL